MRKSAEVMNVQIIKHDLLLLSFFSDVLTRIHLAQLHVS